MLVKIIIVISKITIHLLNELYIPIYTYSLNYLTWDIRGFFMILKMDILNKF